MNVPGLQAMPWLSGLAAAGHESAPGVMRLIEESAAAVNWLLGLVGMAPMSVETLEPWLVVLLPLVAILIMMGPIVTIFPMFAIWLERKVSAHMQSRLGPMEIGWHGWLQSIADGVKLLAKEDIIPRAADPALFVLGPIFAFTGVFLMLVVLPFGPFLSVSDMHLGIIFLAAVGAIEVVGVLMAGWASNNKWSMFGTMRLATQLVSYEIPLGLSFLAVILVAGTFQLGEFNGLVRVERYLRVDEQGVALKVESADGSTRDDVVLAREVAEVREAAAARGKAAWQAELMALTTDRVYNETKNGNKLVPERDAIASWQEVFRKPVKEYHDAEGHHVSVAEAMAVVREAAEPLRARGRGVEEVMAAVEAAVKARFGELEPIGELAAPASYYTLDGQEVAGSRVREVVADVRATFTEAESVYQRMDETAKVALREKFGRLQAVTGYSGQAGWIWNWYLFRNPVMFFMLIIFFTAALAENKRAPFDLPEAESELVSGFHTEYSGMRFSIFFLAEYLAMFIVSMLTAILFLGGWHTGLPLGDVLLLVDDAAIEGSKRVAEFGRPGEGLGFVIYTVIGHGVIMSKMMIFIFLQMWLRWTLPRVRLDHVMDMCLKVLLPFALAGVVLVAVFELMLAEAPAIATLGMRMGCFGLVSLAMAAWGLWFWRDYQAPLQRSIAAKPWDSASSRLR